MQQLKKREFSRRKFLKTIGISSALAPFLPILEQEIFAQGGVPTRFVSIFHPHGGLLNTWDQSLSPLNALKAKMIVFKGITVVSRNSNGASGGHHFHQAAACFSGSENTGTSNLANGASIDQFIAQKISGGQSLVLGVMANEASIRGRISHKGPSQPVTPEQNPMNVFGQLFGQSSNRAALVESKNTNFEKSVLDHVYQDLNRLQASVSQANYQHMQAMMESIRSMERRLSTPSPVPAAGCSAPNIENSSGLDQTLDQFILLISHAFQCNLAQVVSLQILTSMVTQSVFGHLGIQDRLHAISHADAGERVSDAHNKMTKIVSYFYEKIAKLAQSLEVGDSNGGTILDNTLILTGSELGMNTALRHGGQNMPYVMIGGASGRLKTGQVLNANASNNQVLVTAAQAMGLAVNSFGTLDQGKGAISAALR